MRKIIFALVFLSLCSCASTRNATQSTIYERAEAQVDTESNTTTQSQTEVLCDVVSVNQTTTETKSTTTVYDTGKPSIDSLGTSPLQATTTTETKTTSTSSTIDRSVITQIVEEQMRNTINEKMAIDRREEVDAEYIKEDSTPKNLRWFGIIAICGTIITLCFFARRFVVRK